MKINNGMDVGYSETIVIDIARNLNFNDSIPMQTTSCCFFKRLKKLFIFSKRQIFRKKSKCKSTVVTYSLLQQKADGPVLSPAKLLREDSVNTDCVQPKSGSPELSALLGEAASTTEDSLVHDNSSYCRSSTLLNSSSYASNPSLFEVPAEISMVKPGNSIEVPRLPYRERTEALPSGSQGLSYMQAVSLPNELQSKIKKSATKGLLPKAIHKLKAGFLISKRNSFKTKRGFPSVKPPENFKCKRTYRKSLCIVPSIAESSPKVENQRDQSNADISMKSNESVIDAIDPVGNRYLEGRTQIAPLRVENLPSGEILDYAYIEIESLFSALEHLYDHMDLVRNGVQQLMDHFAHPPTANQNVIEYRVVQFQHSIVMLQTSIENLQFAVFKVPQHILNKGNLFLPCNCNIAEFNSYIQDMSVDFEHAQYFNIDSPILTLLKMIVVINLLRLVTSRGRRSFHRSVKFGQSHVELNSYELKDEYKRYVKPTFDLLCTRTRGMIELSNLSNIMRSAWEQTMNWNAFLPFLHLYTNMIETLKPLFVVPNDWYVVRILPETRLMHTFDGFMSEFQRATIIPDFANNNPIAFGAIFNVMKFILDNLIEQHATILNDLKNISNSMEDSKTLDLNENGNLHPDYVNIRNRSIIDVLQRDPEAGPSVTNL